LAGFQKEEGEEEAQDATPVYPCPVIDRFECPYENEKGSVHLTL
jgi:hypothetical protein